MEKTFVMIKPDGVNRGLMGEILSRFEKAGLKIVGLKLMQIQDDLAKKHYGEHIGKPFFLELKEFITSGPVLAMVIQGPRAITICRKLIGATDPGEALSGTIRGDFGLVVGHNLIHGSDGDESAKREIGLFFQEDEILSYSRATDRWL